MKEFLKAGSTVIILGTGGVGKTTVAAALALAGASEQLNTAVVTVDPARRLRDALGLQRLGGKPTPIGAKRLKAAGLKPDSKLAAMMLDVKGAWDELVERFARDPATRRRILENPFYRSLSEQFAGSDAYAALEQLYNLHTNGQFELLIVDTPPAAHAFEFLQAPARIARLLDSRAARWLFTPYVSASRFAMKIASRAARFVVHELERFAGASVLTSISDFFIAAAEAVEGVVDRLRKTEALLHSPEVYFALVTTPEEDRLRQARWLIDEMKEERLKLTAVVVNRLADEQTWTGLAGSAGEMPENLRELDDLTSLETPDSAGGGSAALLDFIGGYRRRIADEIQSLTTFASDLPEGVRLIVIPEIQIGVGDLGTLARIARFLTQKQVWSERARVGTGENAPVSPDNRRNRVGKGGLRGALKLGGRRGARPE